MTKKEPELDPKAIADAASRLLHIRRKTPSDPIEELFNTPIPPEVWHYTNLKGLEGIVTSHRVWATEAHFTNDRTEFVHARDVALDFLHGLNPTTAEDKMAKSLAISVIEEEFESGTLSQLGTQVFIASFSSAENLKSQWNEYAEGGRGVSIAFDLRPARPPQELEFAITVAPCIYKQEHKTLLLEAALKHFMQAASDMHRRTGDEEWIAEQLRNWKVVDTIYGSTFDQTQFQEHLEIQLTLRLRAALSITKFDLLRLASHCKNPYFSEEQEWRIALPHIKSTPLTHVNIQYKGPNGNIPYVAHDLFQQEKLPIARVLLGPRCEAKGVTQLLEKHGYQVPVEKALTPARSPDEF